MVLFGHFWCKCYSDSQFRIQTSQISTTLISCYQDPEKLSMYPKCFQAYHIYCDICTYRKGKSINTNSGGEEACVMFLILYTQYNFSQTSYYYFESCVLFSRKNHGMVVEQGNKFRLQAIDMYYKLACLCVMCCVRYGYPNRNDE